VTGNEDLTVQFGEDLPLADEPDWTKPPSQSVGLYRSRLCLSIRRVGARGALRAQISVNRRSEDGKPI
jgi:hypothetical protein